LATTRARARARRVILVCDRFVAYFSLRKRTIDFGVM
jgi:hypothetical protein